MRTTRTLRRLVGADLLTEAVGRLGDLVETGAPTALRSTASQNEQTVAERVS